MRLLIGVWIIFVLAASRPTEAHHSISMFDIDKPIWTKGTVVGYEAVNPHAIIVLEEATDDGGILRWTVEGPSLRRLAAMELGPDFIQIGDVIEVCGFPPKAQFSSQRPSAEIPGYAPLVFHGHLLLLPGGRMRTWGPYGKLENCVGPDADVSRWVDFVNNDAMARSFWCSGRSFVRVASLAPPEFVDAVDAAMIEACPAP